MIILRCLHQWKDRWLERHLNSNLREHWPTALPVELSSHWKWLDNHEIFSSYFSEDGFETFHIDAIFHNKLHFCFFFVCWQLLYLHMKNGKRSCLSYLTSQLFFSFSAGHLYSFANKIVWHSGGARVRKLRGGGQIEQQSRKKHFCGSRVCSAKNLRSRVPEMPFPAFQG